MGCGVLLTGLLLIACSTSFLSFFLSFFFSFFLSFFPSFSFCFPKLYFFSWSKTCERSQGSYKAAQWLQRLIKVEVLRWLAQQRREPLGSHRGLLVMLESRCSKRYSHRDPWGMPICAGCVPASQQRLVRWLPNFLMSFTFLSRNGFPRSHRASSPEPRQLPSPPKFCLIHLEMVSAHPRRFHSPHDGSAT